MTNLESPPRVIFFQANNNQSKLNKLLQISLYHFEKAEDLFILTPDEKATKFVDDLLWENPKSSFLPHSRKETFSNEKILISSTQKNLFPFLFNLTEKVIQIVDSLKLIYEFDDVTSPKKKDLSGKKFKFYKEKGFLIEMQY